MLSNIGKVAIRGAGVRGSHSSTRVGQSTWQLQRVYANQKSSYGSQSTLRAEPQHLYFSKSTYATTTSAAAKPRTTKTKSSTATEKPIKKVAKKVAKPKVKPKKKKTVAKKRAKPVKKVLTEEQKAKKAETQAKLVIRKLKATALLSEPTGLPDTAWKVVSAEGVKEGRKDGFGAAASNAAAKYKALDPSEREHYNHTANQNKIANEIAYKKWVESHTPDQIRAANLARLALKRRKIVKRAVSIEDVRLPKRTVRSARTAFLVERYKSGDMKGISLAEASRNISNEWHAMSESEKKPFEDIAASDKRRYEQEYKTVFHRDSPTTRSRSTSATA